MSEFYGVLRKLRSRPPVRHVPRVLAVANPSWKMEIDLSSFHRIRPSSYHLLDS